MWCARGLAGRHPQKLSFQQFFKRTIPAGVPSVRSKHLGPTADKWPPIHGWYASFVLPDLSWPHGSFGTFCLPTVSVNLTNLKPSWRTLWKMHPLQTTSMQMQCGGVWRADRWGHDFSGQKSGTCHFQWWRGGEGCNTSVAIHLEVMVRWNAARVCFSFQEGE